MAFVLGRDYKAYYNAGTFGSPTWTEVSNFRKGKLSLAGTTANARRRASGVWGQKAVTAIDITVSWQSLWDLSDTAFMALLQAAYGGTEKDMIFLDGAQTSGSHQGIRMSAAFSKFDRDEDEDGISFIDFEAVGGYGFVPSWFTGS